eukprot:1156139-Pelagomonas_calceolata.AAC.6
MNDFERSGVTFTCMAPDGSDDDVVAEIRCLRMIQRREADVTVVGDYRDNTGPFSSEDLLDYYSIAVVPKTSAMCSSSESNKFNALKDKRACHTGYRKNAGWDLPVGYLALKNIMPIVEDPENKANTDAYSVSQFFSQVCAPRGLSCTQHVLFTCQNRTTPDGPINDGSGSGKKFEGLCGLCSDGWGRLATFCLSGGLDGSLTGRLFWGRQEVPLFSATCIVGGIKTFVLEGHEDARPQIVQEVEQKADMT